MTAVCCGFPLRIMFPPRLRPSKPLPSLISRLPSSPLRRRTCPRVAYTNTVPTGRLVHGRDGTSLFTRRRRQRARSEATFLPWVFNPADTISL